MQEVIFARGTRSRGHSLSFANMQVYRLSTARCGSGRFGLESVSDHQKYFVIPDQGSRAAYKLRGILTSQRIRIAPSTSRNSCECREHWEMLWLCERVPPQSHLDSDCRRHFSEAKFPRDTGNDKAHTLSDRLKGRRYAASEGWPLSGPLFAWERRECDKHVSIK